MSTPVIKPTTPIVILWGTANGVLYNNASVIPFVVETISITPKNGGPIDIEGNQGFTAFQVGLDDGFDGKATCVYDSNLALPQLGDTIKIPIPLSNGTKGTNNTNCTVWSYGFSRGRKNEAKVELSFTNRPDING